MIDIRATCQVYRRSEISSIELVKGDTNPADGLSKLANKKALCRILETRVNDTHALQ